tara:strand:- start:4969 stop:6129 length:1161 start_codon:yes stop_codon:yes gene_type:complete
MYLDDPATSFTIGWQYFSKGKFPDEVAYGTKDFAEDFDAYPNKVRFDKRTSYKGIKTAFLKLENLEPDTRYYFVIKNSFGVSRRFYTHTLPDDRSARISIIAGGDSRNNRGPRQAANLLVAKLKPHFVYFGGDMTNLDFGFEWNDWLDDWQLTTTDDGRVTPIVTARGNHERSNRVLKEFFDLPDSNYYALTIAGGLIRAYVLNTESSIAGDQTTWLENDLKAHQNADYRLAIYHKPMRPHVEKKKEGTNQYTYWAPLFYQYKVDLVVESDAHTSKSTYPIIPSTEANNDEGFIRDDARGTVFVGEGCWGAPLRSADDNKSWTRDSGSFNQFKWIFVDQNKIEVRTVKVDNASSVSELKEEDRFTLPAGIDLWNPSVGTVQTILPK